MGQVYDSAIIRPIPDGLRENLYPVILPIERTRCLLEHHASGYNSQRDENPVIRDTVSSPFSNGFHNSKIVTRRFLIIHPDDENLFD